MNFDQNPFTLFCPGMYTYPELWIYQLSFEYKWNVFWKLKSSRDSLQPLAVLNTIVFQFLCKLSNQLFVLSESKKCKTLQIIMDNNKKNNSNNKHVSGVTDELSVWVNYGNATQHSSQNNQELFFWCLHEKRSAFNIAFLSYFATLKIEINLDSCIMIYWGELFFFFFFFFFFLISCSL